ncbi:Beta-1,4-galactosyltransferase 7 [Chionoecetes opilio]|uniref:Beta-1,4-N-acetylgalactosaminyltransferase n=1 Tax=Chionoecetes opilio TaxID=41210 RepID=A0A8J8WEH3_CHIOP|nr:Beta-1,4-galactosyltransferase 7 [Chionoecetes opilio]
MYLTLLRGTAGRSGAQRSNGIGSTFVDRGLVFEQYVTALHQLALKYQVLLAWEVWATVAAMIRLRRPSSLLWAAALTFMFFLYITLPSNTPADGCLCGQQQHSLPASGLPRTHPQDKHKLALLIPFRDRFEELLEFVPYIHNFLDKQHKNHHVFVINQVDNLRFNRASLLNVGFLESGAECDHIAMHDVDLLPTNPEVTYQFPEEGPYHVSAPHLHPRYHYPTFIGGILLVRREQFRQVDGLSNKYWGWGLEDDEFYARLKEAKLEIFRPGNLTSGVKDTFKHFHDQRRRRRDMIKCYNQQEVTRHRDRHSGLSTVKYTIQSRKEMTIDGAPLTILNTVLECDQDVTPWCDCTENVGNTPKAQQRPSKSEDVIVPKLNRKKHLSHGG